MKLFVRSRYLNFRFTVFLVLSILLISLDQKHHYLEPLRTSLNVVLAPVQYVVNWPLQAVERLQASIVSRQDLLAQNANLKAQLVLLKAQLQKMIMLEQENTQLRALLQSQPRPSDRVLVAQLLSVDSDPFVQQVILNKGTREGVYQGQPVLDAGGVFGQIIETNPFSSRVMLITDTRSAVPVEDSRSGVRGIVVGRGDTTLLNLVDMPVTADIKVGDQLVTSGLGGRYPIGYPVGIVESITQSPRQGFAQISVVPSAHVDRSHLVLLIWPVNDTSASASKAAGGKENVH